MVFRRIHDAAVHRVLSFWGRCRFLGKPAFRAGSRHAFVLESGKSGRYTYLGLSPVSSIRGWGSDCTVEENGITRKWNLPPLEAVQKWMAPYQAPRVPQTPDFTGGCVGFWGYDIVRFLEKLPNLARNDLSLPDYCFLRMEEVWIVDHREKKLYCAVHVPLDRVLPESGSGTYEQKLRKTYDAAARRVEAMKRQWDRMTGKAKKRKNGKLSIVPLCPRTVCNSMWKRLRG